MGPHILKHHIKLTSSLLKKNMDFDYYNNVENLSYGFVNINSVDINLNEVSDHSDFSDTEVVPTYFDFESSMNIEDMMTALDKDIIFSNDEPIPDNDNSFANLEDKVEDIVIPLKIMILIKNTNRNHQNLVPAMKI